MKRAQWIEDTLRAALTPTHIAVEDESAKHSGHSGAPAAGESHFRVLIVSPGFVGMDLVGRQRAVYAALGDAMRDGIHALALKTLTPEEFSQRGA